MSVILYPNEWDTLTLAQRDLMAAWLIEMVEPEFVYTNIAHIECEEDGTYTARVYLRDADGHRFLEYGEPAARLLHLTPTRPCPVDLARHLASIRDPQRPVASSRVA